MARRAAPKRFLLLPLESIGYERHIYARCLGFFLFLIFQGLCFYEGAQFPPTVSLSEYYSVCVELTKEMPTVSHLVTSSVLRLSAKSCKSYLNVLNNSDLPLVKLPKTVWKAVFKVKWPSFSDTEIKFQS